MKIISFGVTKDITGSMFVDLETGKNPVSVKELKEHLYNTYPGLQNLKTLSIAVNNQYASNETMVSSMDEVALIPPVSGG